MKTTTKAITETELQILEILEVQLSVQSTSEGHSKVQMSIDLVVDVLKNNYNATSSVLDDMIINAELKSSEKALKKMGVTSERIERIIEKQKKEKREVA